jgi:hypothetical protein
MSESEDSTAFENIKLKLKVREQNRSDITPINYPSLDPQCRISTHASRASAYFGTSGADSVID